MPTSIKPKDVQLSVQRGFDRFRNFRSARLMFLRNYVGQYYDRDRGDVGVEAINLIFNAIRVLVPNIVMAFPEHKVHSNFLHSKDYAELLGLALKQHDKQTKIRDVYRRVLVDAIFTLGIMKTGLASSGSAVGFDQTDQIDTGTVFTEGVDFDNFVVDPASREHMFRDAMWMGDRIVIPRQNLLDSGLYHNDLVKRLPQAGQESQNRRRAETLSKRNLRWNEEYSLQDEVEVIEMWVPQANTLVTVPATPGVVFDE